jgi:uncharacterized membrane protein
MPSIYWTATGLAMALGTLTVLRHQHFLSHTFDLGFYVQDVWAIAHGEWRNTIFGFHVFADHFSPILVLLAPTAFLSPAEALLVIQAMAVASGAIPAFRIGQRLGGERLGWLATGWYGLSAGIWYATMFDFHPVTLGVPLLLWLIAEAESGANAFRLFLFSVGLAFIREDMAILAAVILIQVAAKRRDGRLALFAAPVGLVGVTYMVWASISSKELGYQFWTRFAPASAGGLTAVGDALSEVAGDVLRPDSLVSAFALLLPMLVVPALLGWRLSWPGLAIILVNGAVSYANQASLYYHYYAPAVPFLIWGSAAAWERFEQRLSRATRLSLFASVTIFVVLGPVVYMGFGLPDRFATIILGSADRAAMNEAVERVPRDLAVSATDFLLPHIADRAEAYPFPGPMVCSPSLIFYVPETAYPPVVVVEWDDTLPGYDWPMILREWGYVETWTDGRVAIWQLRGLSPRPVTCPTPKELAGLTE